MYVSDVSRMCNNVCFHSPFPATRADNGALLTFRLARPRPSEDGWRKTRAIIKFDIVKFPRNTIYHPFDTIEFAACPTNMEVGSNGSASADGSGATERGPAMIDWSRLAVHQINGICSN